MVVSKVTVHGSRGSPLSRSGPRVALRAQLRAHVVLQDPRYSGHVYADSVTLRAQLSLAFKQEQNEKHARNENEIISRTAQWFRTGVGSEKRQVRYVTSIAFMSLLAYLNASEWLTPVVPNQFYRSILNASIKNKRINYLKILIKIQLSKKYSL